MTRRDKILELLNGGDLACAFSNREALEGICHQIAIIEPDLAEAAWTILRRAQSDFDGAAARWVDLACNLRSRALEPHRDAR